MANPSPICEVKNGSDAYVTAAGGVDITPNATVIIRLASQADVDSWHISCATTDDTSDAATVSGALTIDSTNKTATFTAPAAGKAYRFRSRVNGGIDRNGVAQTSYETTFCVYTRINGRRVAAADETTETDTTFGWVKWTNDTIRSLPSGVASGTWASFGGGGGGGADGHAQFFAANNHVLFYQGGSAVGATGLNHVPTTGVLEVKRGVLVQGTAVATLANAFLVAGTGASGFRLVAPIAQGLTVSGGATAGSLNLISHLSVGSAPAATGEMRLSLNNLISHKSPSGADQNTIWINELGDVSLGRETNAGAAYMQSAANNFLRAPITRIRNPTNIDLARFDIERTEIHRRLHIYTGMSVSGAATGVSVALSDFLQLGTSIVANAGKVRLSGGTHDIVAIRDNSDAADRVALSTWHLGSNQHEVVLGAGQVAVTPFDSVALWVKDTGRIRAVVDGAEAWRTASGIFQTGGSTRLNAQGGAVLAGTAVFTGLDMVADGLTNHKPVSVVRQMSTTNATVTPIFAFKPTDEAITSVFVEINAVASGGAGAGAYARAVAIKMDGGVGTCSSLEETRNQEFTHSGVGFTGIAVGSGIWIGVSGATGFVNVKGTPTGQIRWGATITLQSTSWA